MSLVTRCPRCQTTFRVVQDQLRISDGWVRCGQCSKVFDASAALAQEDTLKGAESAPALKNEALAQPLSSITHLDLPLEVPADKTNAGSAFQAGPGAAVEMPPPVTGGAALQHSEPEFENQRALEATPRPSFLRKTPKHSAWHRASVRSALSIAVLAFLAALATQIALQERDRIATTFPQLKPALAWMCGQLGCVIQPLRRIEAVVIESSSLNKMRGEAYRLSLVVKNLSHLEVAIPALELSLVDAADQPLIRKILTPSDLGMGNAVIKSGGEWAGNIPLAVHSASGADRFTGYRVILFYP